MPRVTITVPGKKPQPYRFQLDRQLTRLGRGSENDIVIDCPSVSVRHAEMERVEGGFQLRDLDSTNGTKYQGERRRVIPLYQGIHVRLGDVDFEFQLSDEEREELHKEPELERPLPAKDRPLPEIKLDEEGDERDQGDEGEADDETEGGKEPRRERRPAARPPLESAKQPGALAAFTTTLIVFLLAIIAFLIGMEIQHRSHTSSGGGQGRSLILELLGGKTSPTPDETPAEPAEDPAPAGIE